MIRIGSIVIRVEDLARQRAFWTAALDYVPRDGDDDTFALLRPRSGVGPNVSLDTMRSTAQVPPRIHLDLYAGDQASEVRRLVELGATEVDWPGRPADADYVILADPEGNRFCVIDAAEDGAAVPSDPRVGDAEAEVLRVEQALLAAWGREPRAEVADLIADELSFWSLTGERRDKAAFLRVMATAPVGGATRVEGAEVRVVGDTAVYTARLTDVPADGSAEVRTCVTDVFSRRGRRWVLVASHESLLVDPA